MRFWLRGQSLDGCKCPPSAVETRPAYFSCRRSAGPPTTDLHLMRKQFFPLASGMAAAFQHKIAFFAGFTPNGDESKSRLLASRHFARRSAIAYVVRPGHGRIERRLKTMQQQHLRRQEARSSARTASDHQLTTNHSPSVLPVLNVCWAYIDHEGMGEKVNGDVFMYDITLVKRKDRVFPKLNGERGFLPAMDSHPPSGTP